MILELFLFLVCTVVAIWTGLDLLRAYREMCDQRFSESSISNFAGWMIAFAGCWIFAPASLLMMIVQVAGDDRVSNEWATSIVISFTLLGAFSVAVAVVVRLVIEKMRDQLQENGLNTSTASRAN